MLEMFTMTLAMIPMGVFETINNLNENAINTIRTVAVTAAVIGVLTAFFTSKFSLTKTIMAALVAALMLYGVFNVTDLRDQVGEDLDSATSVPTTTVHTR